MYKERYRKWFITINEGALCYNDIKDILLDLKCDYAYIYHNSDDNVKNNHIHLVLEFENARTFKQVQNLFDGSHIEVIKYFCKCIQYLIHENDNDKRHFDISSIITSYNDINEFFDSVDYPKFTFEDFKDRVANATLKNIVDACDIYGVKQVCKYRCLINDLLDFYNNKYLMVTNISNIYHQKLEELQRENERLKALLEENQK